MEKKDKLEIPLSWVFSAIFVLIESGFSYVVFTLIEDTETRISIYITVSFVLVSLYIFLIIINRRRKIISFILDYKKKITREERIVAYKLKRKYELSKEQLLNRIGINKDGHITSLNLSNFNLDKLPNSLTKLKKLAQVKCKGSKITNLKKFVKQMKGLEIIEFNITKLREIKELSLLTNLRKISMVECGVQSITGLENLSKLEELNLLKNEISDIEPISNLKALTLLNISENQITNIDVLSGLTKLRTVSLFLNPIRDFSPIVRASLETISFSVMFKAYNGDTISPQELMKIKDDWIQKFRETRPLKRFNREEQGGLREYGFSVTLHGGI